MLIIAGSVFVFCGLAGGGIRVRELEIRKLPLIGRVIAGAIGLALLALGLIWSFGGTRTVNPFSAPRILAVAVSPLGANAPTQESGPIEAHPGNTLLLWYQIDAIASMETGLGASIWSPNNEWIHDKRNDGVRHIDRGRAWIAREFHLPQNAAHGSYDVAFGMWDTDFQNQITYVIRDDWIVVGE